MAEEFSSPGDTKMTYEKLMGPSEGQKITRNESGELSVPDHPIIPFIEGDGIGPDIWAASVRVFDAAVDKAFGGKRRIGWYEIYAGEKANRVYGEGTWLPEDTNQAIREYGIAIKGPLTTPIGGGIRSINVALRQIHDLYSCVRPVRWYDGVPSPMKEPGKLDVVLFRENTEDVYSGIDFEEGSAEAKQIISVLNLEMGKKVREDSGIGVKPISETGSKRLVRMAIEYARDNDLRSVTLVHKGNIMKYTEGAFRDWGYELARQEFGDLTISEDELWEKYDGDLPAHRILIKDRIADAMFHLLRRMMKSSCDDLASDHGN